MGLSTVRRDPPSREGAWRVPRNRRPLAGLPACLFALLLLATSAAGNEAAGEASPAPPAQGPDPGAAAPPAAGATPSGAGQVPTGHARRESFDLDGDGRLTLVDLKSICFDVNTLAAAYRGDVNGDGRVDVKDVRVFATTLLKGSGKDETYIQKNLDRFITAVMNQAKPATPADPGAVPDVPADSPPVAPEIASLLDELKGGDGVPLDRIDDLLDGLRKPPKPIDLATEPPAEGACRDAQFSPELSRYSVLGRPAPKPSGPLATIQEINARRRTGVAIAPDAPAKAILAAMARVALCDIALSDTPDPAALGVATASDANLRLVSRGPADDKKEFLPRAPYSLKVNLDSPTDVRLASRVKGDVSDLRDEYRKVAPPTGAAPLPVPRGFGVDDLKPEDALLSSILSCVGDPKRFHLRADLNRDGVVTRAEALYLAFRPSTAAALAGGSIADCGFEPRSPFVEGYYQFFANSVAGLVARGILSRSAVQSSVAALSENPRPDFMRQFEWSGASATATGISSANGAAGGPPQWSFPVLTAFKNVLTEILK